jgi:hypothetical protein
MNGHQKDGRTEKSIKREMNKLIKRLTEELKEEEMDTQADK